MVSRNPRSTNPNASKQWQQCAPVVGSFDIHVFLYFFLFQCMYANERWLSMYVSEFLPLDSPPSLPVGITPAQIEEGVAQTDASLKR